MLIKVLGGTGNPELLSASPATQADQGSWWTRVAYV